MFQVIAGDLILDEVVLHALMKRFDSQFFVILTGQNDDGHIVWFVEQGSEGLRSMAVRKIKVQQYQSGRILAHCGKSISKPVYATHVHRGVALDQAQTN